MKILLIEDDEGVRTTISLLFQLMLPEAQLIETELGESGLDILKEKSPDVVILDLGLPDISGFEVLRRVRHTSSTPVLILTARKEPEDRQRGFELGANDYVTKPFHHNEIIERIKRLAGCV